MITKAETIAVIIAESYALNKTGANLFEIFMVKTPFISVLTEQK